MLYGNSFLEKKTLLLREIIISIIQDLIPRMQRTRPPVCSGPFLPTSGNNWNVGAKCLITAILNTAERNVEYIIQTLTNKIITHFIQAKSNCFLSNFHVELVKCFSRSCFGALREPLNYFLLWGKCSSCSPLLKGKFRSEQQQKV